MGTNLLNHPGKPFNLRFEKIGCGGEWNQQSDRWSIVAAGTMVSLWAGNSLILVSFDDDLVARVSSIL